MKKAALILKCQKYHNSCKKHITIFLLTFQGKDFLHLCCALDYLELKIDSFLIQLQIKKVFRITKILISSLGAPPSLVTKTVCIAKTRVSCLIHHRK